MTLGAYTLAPGPEWTAAAARWSLRAVVRDTEPGHVLTDVVHLDNDGQPFTQTHLVCAKCDQSVVCLIPDSGQPGYLTDAAMIQAGVLRHIRVCHEADVTV